MRDHTDPSYLGAFFPDRLLDPWMMGPRWCGILSGFASALDEHLVHLSDDSDVTMELGEENSAGNPAGLWTDEGRQTYAYALESPVNTGRRRLMSGGWIQLIDDIHKQPGLTRNAWMRRRGQLRRDRNDVLEIDLLRGGDPTHPRPAGSAWSFACIRPWPRPEEPDVVAGSIRDPMPPMTFASSHGHFAYECDPMAALLVYARRMMFAYNKAAYRRPPIGLTPDESAWAAARISTWLARGGEATRGYADLERDPAGLLRRWAGAADDGLHA